MSKLLEKLFSAIVFIAIFLVWGAHIKSCFPTRHDQEASSPEDLKIVEANESNKKHAVIANSLINALKNLPQYHEAQPRILIVEDTNDINAASFGDTQFLFWITLADIPSWARDGIIAHEIAHDTLLHSKKSSELEDVVNVIADFFGIIGHADFETEKTLKQWSSKLTLPKYNRKQELEADQKSTEILSSQGYQDPYGVAYRTLELLLKTYGDQGGDFFDSHPSTSERVDLLRSKENPKISDILKVTRKL